MILRIVSGLLLLLVVSSAMAINEARLIRQSKSRRTALFNLGIHDGIKEGDFAVIAKQIRSQDVSDLKVVPVAKARNIKINTDSSVWVLYHIYNQELLVENDKFQILAESVLLNGRRVPETSRVKVVSPKQDTSDRAKDALTDDRDRLGKLKDKYPVAEVLHDREDRIDSDFELIDLEEWEKVKGKRYRTALYRSPNRQEFRRTYRLETFQRLVANYLRKVNEPGFNYDSFYDYQMRWEFSNEFRKRSSLNTEYENFIKDQTAQSNADAKLYRSLLEEGETWSEDFSDEELGTTLRSVSVLQEQERRDKAISRPLRYSISADYSRHGADTQNGKGNYRREERFTFEVDLEFIPFIKHDRFERFTIFGGGRNNRNALEVSNLNANFNDYTFRIGSNWYPFKAPYLIETPLIFIGTFFRTGYGNIEVPEISQKANYTVYSLPAFHAGVKYMFRSHFSARAIASIETLSLERYEANQYAAAMPQNRKLFESKIGVGLGYSF